MNPGVYVERVQAELQTVKRFNPYAEDLTAEFFACVNDVANKYQGYSINSQTKGFIERELWMLTSHLEMSGLMAPRMKVATAYDGDHGAGRMVIELLDRELLPIRKREPGYVPQVT
jgi:hypothetical protein